VASFAFFGYVGISLSRITHLNEKLNSDVVSLDRLGMRLITSNKIEERRSEVLD
jgi:hypothetical protein